MSDFSEIYQSIKHRTLVSEKRCQNLYDLSRSVSLLPGDIGEVGVYNGGTSLLLARANCDKSIHAFDTFSGISNATKEEDRHSNGDFRDVDLQTIDILQKEGIEVHRGYFPETADPNLSFCFAHFDGDTYQSCKDFIAYFYPRLSSGGILIFDDYLWEHCPGVEKALIESGLSFIQSEEYQAYLVKP